MSIKDQMSVSAGRLADRVEATLAAEELKEQIRCPGCGYVFDEDDKLSYVSMWGEDSGTEDGCPECEVDLTIKEYVTRSWDVSLTTDH